MTIKVGEFDMLVHDPKENICTIYEIKHSTKTVNRQIMNLVNEENLRMRECVFGTITGRYVIYRGESCVYNSIQYLNVEEYLRGLHL